MERRNSLTLKFRTIVNKTMPGYKYCNHVHLLWDQKLIIVYKGFMYTRVV